MGESFSKGRKWVSGIIMKWHVINSNAARSVIWSLASISLPTCIQMGNWPVPLPLSLKSPRRPLAARRR